MAHIVEAINLGLLFSWNIELADVVAESEAQFGKKDIDCFDEFSDGLDLAILTALIQVAGSNEQVKVRNELIALKTISFWFTSYHLLIKINASIVVLLHHTKISSSGQYTF